MGEEHNRHSLIIQGALFGADDRDPLASSHPTTDEQKTTHDRLAEQSGQSARPIVTARFRDQALWEDHADQSDDNHQIASPSSSSHEQAVLPGLDVLFGPDPVSSDQAQETADRSSTHSKRTSRNSPKKVHGGLSRRVRLFRERFEKATKGEHSKVIHRHIHDEPDTVGQGGRMINREAQKSRLFSFSLFSELGQQNEVQPLNESPLDIVYGSAQQHSSATHTPTQIQSRTTRATTRTTKQTRQLAHIRWILSFPALRDAANGPYSFDFSLSYSFWDRLSALIFEGTVGLPDFVAHQALQQMGDPNLAQWINDLARYEVSFPGVAHNEGAYAHAIEKITHHLPLVVGEPAPQSSADDQDDHDVEFISVKTLMTQAHGF